MSSLPEKPFAHVGEVMSSYPATWIMCGGWAVDSWLGRKTRDHIDIDIVVFAEDQRALFEHLAGWNIVAHDKVADSAGWPNDPWDGRPLTLPAHLHARPPGEENREALMRWVTPPHQTGGDDQDYDIVFNERVDGRWLLSDQPPLSLPIEDTFVRSVHGVPIARPEILLFYKATAYFDPAKPESLRPHDHADFDALSLLLEPAQRSWLRDAVSARFPAHPWLDRLNL